MSSGAARPHLAVDIGNTATKIARVLGSDVELLSRVPTPRPNGAAPSLLELPVLPVLAVSVVRESTDIVLDAVRRITGEKARLFGRDLPPPLVLDYRTPETLGLDRVLAAYAAWKICGGAAVVVSAGTALTADLVDARGTFRGGAIAPGLHSLGSVLKSSVPALERVEPDPRAEYPGRSTIESLRSGITAAARGLARDLIGAAVKAAGQGTPIIVTGGDAGIVMALLPETPLRHHEHLVLKGLGIWALENA